MSNTARTVAAVILAAGSGSRMSSDVTKQRMSIVGESVLLRSVRAFEKAPSVSSITVICREDEIEWARAELKEIKKLSSVECGGKTRAESAKIGFNLSCGTADFVAIHDAARCLVTCPVNKSN